MADRPALAFANARIVTRDAVVQGDLAVRDGCIAAIGAAPAAGAAVEDLDGDYLLPGLVELHTDHLEPHFIPRPKVRWDPLAAVLAHDAQIAGSGITTVFDALRVGGDADSENLGRDSLLLAQAIGRAEAAGILRAAHLMHLRCEVSAADALDGFEMLKAQPGVRLVSVMDHTPGQRQFVSMDAYRTYYMGKTGMTEAQLDAYIARRREQHLVYAAPHRRRIVAAVAARGIPLASHDDATEAHVAEAVADGAAIAEFPTTIAAAEAAQRSGLKVLMGAPNVVLGGSHSGNVSAAALAAAGLLDILSSDYVPCSLLQAAFLLPSKVPGMGLPDAVRTVSLNPAAATGLDDRGEIAEGRRADLIRVHLADGHPVVRGVWRQGRRVA